MNVQLPRCPECHGKCQLSTVYGFFKCVNPDCMKYQSNMVDDLKLYEMIHEQWSTPEGKVHHRKGKGLVEDEN